MLATSAGDNPAAVSTQWAYRGNHVHAEGARPIILEQARRKRWSFLDRVVVGVFAVAGDGAVDLAAALQPLQTAGYAGWMIVETANPLDYARQGYAHLPKTAQHLGFKIMSEEAA